MRATLAISLCAMLLLGQTFTASAALSEVGPVNPTTGFPLWYRDANGLTLDLMEAADPFSISDPVDLANPDSVQIGFNAEGFWWSADATFDNGVQTGRLVLGMEAAFSGNAAVNGEQSSFGRVRYRLDGLTPGATYTVRHPYANVTEVADAAGTINVTNDIGCFAILGVFSCNQPTQPNFSTALQSEIGPFLTWDTFNPDPAQTDPQLINLNPAYATRSYVGNPGVAHAITGSPIGQNYFRVEGADLPGGAIQVNDFIVSGRVAAVATNTITVNVLSTNNPTPTITGTVSDPTATVTVTVDAQAPITATVNPDGTFSATVIDPLADGPHEVVATAIIGGNPISDISTNELTIDTLAPSIPADPIATPASPNQIDLSWTASTDSTGVVGYKLYKEGVFAVDVNGTTYSDLNLQPNSTHNYTVSAIDAAGNESGQSVVASATTPQISVTVTALNTSITSPELTGTVSDPTAVISVAISGNTYGATNNGDGTWTLAAGTINPPLTAGIYDVSATVVDQFNNTASDTTLDELTVTEQPVPVIATFHIVPDLSYVAIGDAKALVVEALDELGNPLAVPLSWSNSDPTLGSIDQNGNYTALAVGTDIVTVQSGDNTATATMLNFDAADTQAPVISIDPLTTADGSPEITGSVDEPVGDLTIQIYDQTDTLVYEGTTPVNKSGNWSFPADTIDPPLAEGVYDVKIIVSDLAGNPGTDTTTAELTISAAVLTTLNLTPATANLQIGQTQSFIAETLDQFGMPMTAALTWSNSNPTFGSIDQNGVYTASAAGTDTITVQAGDLTKTAKVNVYAPDDTTAPTVIVYRTTTNDTTPIIMGTVNEVVSTITIEILDKDGNIVFTGNKDLNASGAWTYSSINPPLAYGTYDVKATALDLAGNSGTDATKDELRVKDPNDVEDPSNKVPTVTVNTQTAATDTPTVTGTVSDPAATVMVKIADQASKKATVDATGNWSVTAGAALPDGTYEVVATASNIKGSATDTTTNELTVNAEADPVLTTINVDAPAAPVKVGNTHQFTAQALDQNGQPIAATLTWASSDTAVGTIDANTGLFTAVTAGSTTITATSGPVSGTANINVTTAVDPGEVEDGTDDNPKLTKVTGTNIDIRWTASTAGKTKIYLSNSKKNLTDAALRKSKKKAKTLQLDNSTTTHVVSLRGLKKNKSYYFRIATVNADGSETLSPMHYFKAKK